MAKFRDNKGREWVLALDVWMADQLKQRVEFDLDTCLDDELAGLTDLLRSSVRLCRAAYVLCEEQADRAGVSPEDFGRSVGGDSLQGMRTAFMEAVADFSPPHQRKTLLALIRKGQEVAERAADLAIEELGRLDPFASAKSSPASSGSTPAPAG